MAAIIEKLKRDFAKHKAKAGVLGVLSVVMVVFIIKGTMEMAPRSVAAEISTESAAVAAQAGAGISHQETENRFREGEQLWRVLREKRGVEPSIAFTFDPSYFTPDPNRKISPVVETTNTHVEPNVDSVVVKGATTEETERRAKIAAIREQARALSVKSTVVGGARPIAVINERILTVGDRVQGFEIIAIRAREVEFKKDDVTIAVTMASDSRSQ